jgi:S1-C subfamily serine protease
MFKNVKISLLALAFFLGGCANSTEHFDAYLTYYPVGSVASIVPPQKQTILFLFVEDIRGNVQSARLKSSSTDGNKSSDGLSLATTVTNSISNALKKELNLLGIQLTQNKNHAQAYIKATVKKIESSEEGMFGPFSSFVDIDFEVVKAGKTLPMLKEALHGEHVDSGDIILNVMMKELSGQPFDTSKITGLRQKVLDAAFGQAIRGLRQSLKFKQVIVDLSVYSPDYLAQQKILAQIKSELVPLDSKFRITADIAKIRKLPRPDSEVIKEIGLGSILQIVGKLPSGWMQVAREGESIGWIHGDSVAIDSTFTPQNRQQAQAEKKPSPQSGTGSGFFVSKMGHVITNAHVVKGCKRVTVGDNATKQVPAEVISADRRNDLALLKITSLEMASAESKSLIQKLSIAVVPLASKGLLRSEDVRLGEKVMVAGYPFGDFFSNSIKVTTGIVSATRGAGDDSGQFQLDAAVQPGNSGGPIYDSGGNIVGVVISQLDKLKVAKAIGSLPENVNFGIKASTVRQFLISSGLPSKKAEKVEEKSTEQLAAIAKNQALMVMCSQ